MFKTQVEPRAAGEWFHYHVLNILWRHCVRRKRNTLLIAFRVEIVWDNQRMNGSWDAYLASPADFVGVDDLAKEREPGIEIIERTPYGPNLFVRVQTIESVRRLVFYDNMEKSTKRNWLYFPRESACVTSDVNLIVCTRIDKSYEPISALKFWQLL